MESSRTKACFPASPATMFSVWVVLSNPDIEKTVWLNCGERLGSGSLWKTPAMLPSIVNV